MSKLLGGLWAKLLAVFVIVMFIIVFREMIITDDGISEAFKELMNALPFAKPISEVVCGFLEYKSNFPHFTSVSVISDLLKLAVMSILRPLVTRYLFRRFLFVPRRRFYEMEAQMSRVGYRVKEMLITLFATPLFALASAWIIEKVSGALLSRFGPVIANLIQFASLAVISIISVSIFIVIASVTLMTAIFWHLGVTLAAEMINSLALTFLCMWLYLSVVGGMSTQTLVSVFSIILWLIIFDFGVQCLQRSVASKNL